MNGCAIGEQLPSIQRRRVSMEPSPIRNEKLKVFQSAILLCFLVFLFLVLLLYSVVQPFIFLVVMALGMIVGMIHSRLRYPEWQHVRKMNSLRRETKWYVGCSLLFGSLFLLIAPFIANRLAEPLNTIFTSALFGALGGYFIGYFLWFVALYASRNKAESN